MGCYQLYSLTIRYTGRVYLSTRDRYARHDRHTTTISGSLSS